MGKYDVPAAIAYVLNATNASKLSYIGHSMGTTMFFVAMNEHQAWMKQRVDLMIGLAPVASVKNTTNPFWTFSPYANELEVCNDALVTCNEVQ
jgi:pimeloyl-ACP methyl ester carboxylesterase